jgi:hypothetical protein
VLCLVAAPGLVGGMRKFGLARLARLSSPQAEGRAGSALKKGSCR